MRTRKGIDFSSGVSLKEEAVDIVKSGLEIEENILTMSLDEYRADLETFERKYKMSSEEFIQKFESGDLGDDADWFDFLFAYRAYEHVKKKLKLIEEIQI